MVKKTKRYRIRKTIAHYADFDYLNKLTAEEKAWLLQFCDEYYHAAVRKKPKPDQIHKDAKHITDLYGANNARNRDVMNKFRVRLVEGDVPGQTHFARVNTPKEIVFKDFVAVVPSKRKSRARKSTRRRK